MGACFQQYNLPKDVTTEAQARECVANVQRRLCDEYGTGAYQGHLGIRSGCTIKKPAYASRADAIEDAEENHGKWDCPWLMQYPEGWTLAGWCSE
jgi:hypothetical protein